MTCREPSLGRVALISLEPWDEVWRRNQHLSTRLVSGGWADSVLFVNPAVKLRHRARVSPRPGVDVRTPHLVLPRHRGGISLVARELRPALRTCDLLWINDAGLGAACAGYGLPMVYDVTDDWRTSRLSPKDLAMLVRAEDVLSRAATTIVCSSVLQERWRNRYGAEAIIVQNGADVAAHRAAIPISLPGSAPHLLYAGSLHAERLDVDLLTQIVASKRVGTLHLVGPNYLDEHSFKRLHAMSNVIFHGPVNHESVPRWMSASDLLLSPHLMRASARGF